MQRKHLDNNKLSLPAPGADMHLTILDKPGAAAPIRASKLLGIRKGYLLLQQTSPPLSPDNIDANIQLSYVLRQDGDAARVGFVRPLASVVSLPGDKGQILLFNGMADGLKAISLREGARIVPGPGVIVNASLQMEGLSMPMTMALDISIGGAKLLLPKGGLPLSEGQRLTLSLTWEKQTILLPAALLRQERLSDRNSVSVRFVNPDADVREQLKTMLTRIWQKQLMARLDQASRQMAELLREYDSEPEADKE
jgi:hypothetical protein